MKKKMLNSNRVGLALVQTLTSCTEEKVYDDAGRLVKLIHKAMIEYGLGRKQADNPLLDIISPGMTVFIKPNWVLHYNQGSGGMACMITHSSFLRAVVSEVLRCRPSKIIIGDAPIQSCIWESLVTTDLQRSILKMASCREVEVVFTDFRRTILREMNPAKPPIKNSCDEGMYVLFDLASDSLLEPISGAYGKFRAPTYSPRKLAKLHDAGTHKYLLARAPFDADIILSLPKLKMHKKTGITCALKTLVGLIGDKDFLAHNRVGGFKSGGDAYPGNSVVKRITETLTDKRNGSIGSRRYNLWNLMAFCTWQLTRFDPTRGLGFDGNWHGNDTCWRMVLDLNRILIYGKSDGTMAEEPQRKLYSLTDAIICGQGNGPLHPSPIFVGAVTFSDSAPTADVVHASLLRVDYKKAPLIREAFGNFRWPLAEARVEPQVYCDNQLMTSDEVARKFGVNATPAPGWVGRLELEDGHDCISNRLL